MKNFILICATLLIFQITENSKSQEMYSVDSLFPEIRIDTLHLYDGMVNTWLSGNFVPSSYIDNYHFAQKGIIYYAMNRFYIDKLKKYKAYLFIDSGSEHWKGAIYLVIYNTTGQKELIFRERVAFYTYLSTAYEETQNAWIADFDGDGNIDIGIYNQIIDFEMSTDDAPNTSGSNQYIYVFKNGKYEMMDWKLDILKRFQLIK